ncbi:uncharacterized protein CDAR_67161 [Caerostris darwini]|uniref:Secreted protein n=1 Tax=Caerostris darwini TaxID=1538125 RepID=A0AAV4QZ22_9ARAC|nr:uncharacterized protein CDAR_67161 [Caerostris darwini]
MWILFVSLFALWNVVLGVNHTCIREVEYSCGSSIPNDFPVTIEELQRACSVFQNVRTCYLERLSECGADNLDAFGTDFSRLIATIAEICQEDTQLHSTFAQHMSCLKEVISTEVEEQSCYDYERKAADYIRIHVERKNTRNDENHVSKYFKCLRPLFDMNCFTTLLFNKCGDGAKDMAIEVIQKGGSVDKQCPEDIRIDILDLLQTLESATQSQMYVKELLTTFKLL